MPHAVKSNALLVRSQVFSTSGVGYDKLVMLPRDFYFVVGLGSAPKGVLFLAHRPEDHWVSARPDGRLLEAALEQRRAWTQVEPCTAPGAPRFRSRLAAPHTPHFTDPESDLARPDASQISRPLPAPIGQVSQPTRAGEAGALGVQAAQARAALPQPPCCPAHAALYRSQIGSRTPRCQPDFQAAPRSHRTGGTLHSPPVAHCPEPRPCKITTEKSTQVRDYMAVS